MSSALSLIPKQTAMIVWKPKKRFQEDFALKVYFRDLSQPVLGRDIYENWPKSSGCCVAEWAKMSESEMFGECMRILFSERISNKDLIKKAIFEFGKIKELTEMRRLYHKLYYEKDMPFDGLMASFYGWDFCDGR